MLKKILIPVDGSEPSFKAVELGSDIGNKYDADILLIHMVPVEEVPEAIRRFAKAEHLSGSSSTIHHKDIGESILSEGKRRAAAHGVDNVQSVVADGNPAQTIIRYARENAIDFIVLGDRGLGGLAGLILGSVSHKVLHRALCSCLTVR